MAKLRVKPQRFDAYKDFRLRISWGAGYVAGMSKLGGLGFALTDALEHRDGGDPSSSQKLPRRSDFEPITLARGVTHDQDFEQWANDVEGGKRRDLVIDVYDEAGRLAIRYRVFRCRVSEFRASSDLDANGRATVIEHLKLEHEGWERDTDVPEPTDENDDHLGASDDSNG